MKQYFFLTSAETDVFTQVAKMKKTNTFDE